MRGSNIKNRVFLIGCVRSGTTLLQALLGAHPEIATYPESRFFHHLFSENERWRRVFGLAPRKSKFYILQYLRELDRDELQIYLKGYPIFLNQFVKTFVTIFDTMTEQQNKTMWLEKSPIHLWYIDSIEKHIPEAKFLHLTRDGREVVASMYDTTHRFPDLWGGPRDIDTCINRWNEDIKITINHMHKSNHIVVKYEDILSDAGEVLKKICNFLGVEYREKMLVEYRNVVDKIILNPRVPWKNQIKGPIRSIPLQKFYEIFSEEQQKYITDSLSVMNIKRL
jgi:hypothetical protein